MWGVCCTTIVVSLLLSLKCSSQSTTSAPIYSSSSSTKASLSSETSPELNFTSSFTAVTVASNGSTVMPTTMGNFSTTTSTNYTCRASLNKSPNLSPFWVTTVLSSVPSTTDISNCSWGDMMETRLLTLLATGRALSSSGRRRRRAAESGQLVLQLVSAVRGAGTNITKVSLVYYAQLSGSYLPAGSVVASLTAVSSSAASVLGYAVDSVAASYESLQTSTSYLWLIGAMFGGLAGIVVVIWAVLLVYQNCLRPRDPDKRRSVDTSVDDFYTDGALANMPDMRANPRIGFSKADIGTIADEVARHLDSHMSELVQSPAGKGRRGADGIDGPPARRRPSDASEAAGSDEPPSAIEEEAPIEAARAGVALSAGRESSGLTMEERRRDKKEKKKEKKMEKKREKEEKRKQRRDSEAEEDDDDDEDENDEEEKQEKSSASMQNGGAHGDQGPADEATDDGNSFHMLETSAPKLSLSLTADSLLTAAHPAVDLKSSLTSSLAAGAMAASPYRTADQLARIRPILEEDLKRQDLSQPRKPPRDSADAAAAAPGGSRLISVRPRPTREAGSGRSQSALAGGGITTVTPAVRPANQDEWDVVRELARRPDSDTRALLSSVRREVAEFASGAGPAAAPGVDEGAAAPASSGNSTA